MAQRGNMKRDTLTKSRTQGHGHSKLLLLASELVNVPVL